MSNLDGLPGVVGSIEPVGFVPPLGNGTRCVRRQETFGAVVTWTVGPRSSADALDGTWHVRLVGLALEALQSLVLGSCDVAACGSAQYAARFDVSMVHLAISEGAPTSALPLVYKFVALVSYRTRSGVDLGLVGCVEGGWFEVL